jgi:Protein of unknown function (DUF429)
LARKPFTVLGVDVTSAPRRGKPITIAQGMLQRDAFVLEAIHLAPDFAAFELWLDQPGPWIAGIDAPFGLPREAVRDLGWPEQWDALVRHCAAIGKTGFRAALDRYRESRPVGNRYAHRVTDRPAKSHSPLKLVNPPVGLMFLATTPRLLAANVSIPGVRAGEADRIAIEAYPGFAARMMTQASYKSDDRAKQTTARLQARKTMVERLITDGGPFGFRLATDRAMKTTITQDASGDHLDAVLAALQAAWSLQRATDHFGLPPAFDPIEGWIATVPCEELPA